MGGARPLPSCSERGTWSPSARFPSRTSSSRAFAWGARIMRVDYDVEFLEHDHAHHAIQGYAELDVAAPGYQDPHELAHANDIRRRFAGREVTTPQIIVFGLTGG